MSENKTSKSVFWSILDRFSTTGIQLVLNILIARILLPSDYGLIAMLGIFLVISQIFVDSGFSNALIQRADRSETDFSTVFYFNLGVACIIYCLLYWVSPYIAVFYNYPQLVPILKILGLNLIIGSLAIIQRVKLIIRSDFKTLAICSLLAVLISGLTALWMAYHDFGVWTLVYQTLLNTTLSVFFLFMAVHWHPQLVFSRQSFKNLFSFGTKILMANLISSIYTNLYTLVIGKKYASTELGYYNRAYSLAYFSTGISDVIMRVVYPVFCDLQNDPEKLKELYLKYLKNICFVVFPLMIGICSLAKPVIYVLLSEKWMPAAVLLQILCLAYMWYPVIQINMNLINSVGRSDYSLRAEWIKKIVACIILLLTLPWGVKVMCVGLIISYLFDTWIIMYFLSKVLTVSVKDQLKTIFPIFLLAGSMGAVVYCVGNIMGNRLQSLLIGVVTGVVYYFLLSRSVNKYIQISLDLPLNFFKK